MIPFLAPAAAFLSPVGNFLKRIPDWVIWVLAAVVLLKFVDIRAERRGVQKQKGKTAVEVAKEAAKIETTRREITEDQAHDAERSREAAAAAPRFNSYDELRNNDPGAAAELFGDREGNSRPAEGR